MPKTQIMCFFEVAIKRRNITTHYQVQQARIIGKTPGGAGTLREVWGSLRRYIQCKE